MKKKVIYFILFLLVCCVNGYFLVNPKNIVNILICILLVCAASCLLNKAFPINYKKKETDKEK